MIRSEPYDSLRSKLSIKHLHDSSSSRVLVIRHEYNVLGWAPEAATAYSSESQGDQPWILKALWEDTGKGLVTAEVLADYCLHLPASN